MSTYSFQDFYGAIAGPGGVINMGAGSENSEEGITIEFSEDADLMKIGADGAVMHSLNASKAGEVITRLLKTSPVNVLLTTMYNFQRTSGAFWGKNVITLRDIARGDVITARSVAFAKYPSNSWGKEGGMLEWRFRAGFIDPLLGSVPS